MTKEELKQKAYEYAIKEIPFIECITQNDLEILVQQAYITGAESREKRIAKLEAQIEKVKHYLDYDIPHDLINEATTKIWRMLK